MITTSITPSGATMSTNSTISRWVYLPGVTADVMSADNLADRSRAAEQSLLVPWELLCGFCASRDKAGSRHTPTRRSYDGAQVMQWSHMY